MRRRRLLVIVICGGLLAGCDGERPQPSVTRTKQEQELTAEAAKRCLLEMEASQIPPGVIIPPPKDEPIRHITADEIALGVWECNLKKRTFYASAFYPEAIHHKINEISGVFEQSSDEKWVAKVTSGKSSG